MTRFARRWYGRADDAKRLVRSFRPEVVTRRRVRLRLQPLEDRTVPNTYTVTSAADTIFDPNDFRSAIENANKNVGADTIVFDSSFNNPPLTITLTSGELTINGSLTVVGPPSGVTIDGNNNGRVLNINGTGTVVVSMSDLTITGGLLSGTNQGGGILIGDESVTLTRCTVRDNKTTSAGGGIAVVAGSLTIQDSTLSGNSATGGGAIYFNGPPLAGGFTVLNSTISGNSATSNIGGGILLGLGFNGTCTVQNSTITANSAKSNGGGISRVQFSSGVINIESTIVSGNAGKSTGDDISNGGKVIANFSAIGDSTGFTLGGSNNLPFGIDLKLGPLQDNGGQTLTHVPATKSPVLDQGANSASLVGDQRGVPRQSGSDIDIGAVERQPGPLIVDITVDEADGNFGPGDLSLREAIAFAVASAATESRVVIFDASVFATTKTITLTLGEIPISGPVTVTGPANKVRVSGNNASRIFNSSAAPDGTAIELASMTFSEGYAVGDGGAYFGDNQLISLTDCALLDNNSTKFGGAVSLDDGTLTVTDCTFSNNAAGAGGAVFMDDGTLTATGTTFSNNNAAGIGGAVYMDDGTLTATGSTFSNNNANSSGAIFVDGLSTTAAFWVFLRGCSILGNTATGFGGGLYTRGYLLVENSTVSGNSVTQGNGGGIWKGTLLLMTVVNSTISGNTAKSNGGGIYLKYNGKLVLQNSTVAFNSATGKGGGIASIESAGYLIALESSVVSNNTGPTGFNGANIFTDGKVQCKSSSIFSAAGIDTYSDQGGNRPFFEDPQLLPLASNGGPTLTHALAPTSPLINGGTNPATLTTDQRGGVFTRKSGTEVDIGAYEFQPGAKVLSVQVNDNSPQRSRVTSLTVTFDQSVTLPTNKADAFQLKRQSDNAAIALSASMMGNAVTLSFLGGPLEFGSLVDGRYTLTVLASQVSGGLLDGNGDGGAGDSYVLIGTPANGLFRLFGDSDGDGTVAANDFIQFRLALGGNNPIFDFDNDGAVAASDFIQFRLRFGGSV